MVQGYTRTTYDRLVEKLGLPTFGPNDHTLDKSTCQWVLDADGKVLKPNLSAAGCFEIYDWKTDVTPRGQYAWHIGGLAGGTLQKIKDLVELGREEGDSHYTLVKQPNAYFKIRVWRKGRGIAEHSLGKVVRKFTEQKLWAIQEAHGHWAEMYTEGDVTPEELTLTGGILMSAWSQAEADKELRQEAKKARREPAEL